VRQVFHVLPGQSILETGAGSGLWTEHLVDVFPRRERVTAAIFDEVMSRVVEASQTRHT
jgi:hypothetical protein